MVQVEVRMKQEERRHLILGGMSKSKCQDQAGAFTFYGCCLRKSLAGFWFLGNQKRRVRMNGEPQGVRAELREWTLFSGVMFLRGMGRGALE